MTEAQILNHILDQIQRTGPISSQGKAKELAKRLAMAMVVAKPRVEEKPNESTVSSVGDLFRRPKRKLGESSEFTSEES